MIDSASSRGSLFYSHTCLQELPRIDDAVELKEARRLLNFKPHAADGPLDCWLTSQVTLSFICGYPVCRGLVVRSV